MNDEASRESPRFATMLLHGNEGARTQGVPVSPSIVTATSFYSDPSGVGFSANDLVDGSPAFYSRWGNPTVAQLEARLSLLEQGNGAVAFASGMAAISALFMTRLKSGDHLILSDICYPGVAEFANEILPRFGITTSAVDTSQADAVSSAIVPGKTQLIHVETPANPTLRISDIAALSEIAHDAGAELSVDSTIATPIATQPLTLGADYVVHSLTKYICGHGDALGGIIIGRDEKALSSFRKSALVHHGATLSPFAAWLILRGLETLAPRMRLHEENARAVALFLSRHPSVDNVFWPGMDDHPQAGLAKRQMRNFSGLLSFTVRDDSHACAKRMAKRLTVASYAVSLGKTKTLLFYIPTDDLLRTSFRLSAEAEAAYRRDAGDGVFRLSVGLEDSDDIIEDLAGCLDQKH